jgi:hypothetical protein
MRPVVSPLKQDTGSSLDRKQQGTPGIAWTESSKGHRDVRDLIFLSSFLPSSFLPFFLSPFLPFFISSFLLFLFSSFLTTLYRENDSAASGNFPVLWIR